MHIRYPETSLKHSVSHGMLEHIEGCRLLECKEIILTDHRSYLMYLNLEDYFQDQMSSWDEINKVMLNPSRKSHREKFVQSIEDQLEHLNLEAQMSKVFHHPSNEQIEKIDETITSILNNATNSVEGMRRNIPFSPEKQKRRGAKLCWKDVVKRKRATN